MLAPRHEIARLQSDFYRDKFRKMLWWLLISLVINLLIIAVITYLLLFPAPPTYFASTTEGKILPMTRFIEVGA